MPITCPSLAELERLLRGGLPEGDAERLEQHVQGCNTCLDQLTELLNQKDTFAGLRDGSDPATTQARVTDWVNKLKTFRTASTHTVPSPDVSQDEFQNAPTVPPASQPDPTESPIPPGAESDTSLTDFLVPPQAADEIGRLGKYRILRILGAGGMGVVYKAEDSQLQRLVAVKVMLPGLAASASAGKRFLREARAMAKVESDHIVRIYQVEEDHGVPFMAMEFLKGEPLNDCLKRETRLPLEEVLRIGREIADGLGAAHALGLIHRDIKPGNIWLEEPRRRVKILDFGLARAASQEPEAGLTQQGAIIGTPGYMAPEQWGGETIDARCDLFSLGVVLYRMSTGRQPFEGSNTIALLMAVATEEPAAPKVVNPDLPQEFSDLVMRLLEKEPPRRPGSAAEVIQSLKAIEHQWERKKAAEADTVALPPPPKQAPTPRRRWLIPVAAAVLLAGLIGVTTAVAAFLYYKAQKNEVANERPPAPVQKEDPDPWPTKIAALPPEQQVEEVVAELKKLNPEFDGQETHKIEDGKVTGLEFVTDHVTDISPLRALTGLRSLTCSGTPGKGQLKDLSPLKNLKLTDLIFHDTQVAELSPLRGMPLTYLRFEQTPVDSLAPLAAMKLTFLQCDATKVSDLSPLKDMPLTYLRCGATEVADLSPLTGLPLRTLDVTNTRVVDLSPLKDAPLTNLSVKGTPVTNLAPIQALALTDIQCDFRFYRDNDVLRSIKTLATINGKPVRDFWLQVDKKHEDFEAWRRRIVNRPGTLKLGDVFMKLREENLDFDGKSTAPPQHKAGEISGLTFSSDKVTELQGLRALPHLEVLNCPGSAPGKGMLADLSPLKGVQLTSLNCSNTKVADLLPLQGMKLTTLAIDHTKVTDLSPLRDMKLTDLSLAGTPVADLSPLKGMPLDQLNVAGTQVTDLSDLRDLRLRSFNCSKTQVWDLSPLKDMPLTAFECAGSQVTDFSVLKDKPLKTITADFNLLRDADSLRPIRTLDKINGKPAKEFWKEVAAKQQALDQWCKEVAAQPTNKQKQMVADKLKEQNSGFHGPVEFGSGEGVVTYVALVTDDVTDLSPLRALPSLRAVNCAGTSGKGPLTNLGPLKDLNLTDLTITGTRVTDLSPLRKLPLKELRCDDQALKDMESLKALKPTLEKINGKPAAEFWKSVDEKQP